MKRIRLAAAALALAATACGPPAANEPGAMNAPIANTAVTPAARAPFSDADIIGREQKMWERLKAKDFDSFAAQLSDDHLYVSSDGLSTKEQLVGAIRKLALTDLQLTDFKVIRLGPDAALVTYTANVKGTYDGAPLPPQPERNSSAWVRRDDRWLSVYHQDTYAEEPQAAPTTDPEPTVTAAPAQASPTPISSTAAGGDPLSLERRVWDAIKRRDYDAFASLLADDAVEVEPDGVYTRQQTVAALRQLDLSAAELSDFKEFKLSADATLVTYLVKGPREAFGPEGARHTTVWYQRDGRYLAVFHHGTLHMK